MEIRVENVRKTYQSSVGKVEALKGVSLVVPSGTVTTLLGPSGCGKTTLLRCIAGLETPDSGTIAIGDTVVWSNADGRTTFVTPDKRGIGMVFQTYAIWPHMTVFDNVAYPLEAQGVPRSEIAPRVSEALEFVQLAGYEKRPATALSGGQQQRVSLARAIVSRPRVILFDEPLSNLDAKLREETRAHLRKLLKHLGITSLYVTHDRFEALALSDEVVVMKDGEIVQRGTPEDVYFRADSQFAVDFLGKANFLPGVVRDVRADGVVVETAVGSLLCEGADEVREGQQGTVAIRMEFVELLGDGGSGQTAGGQSVVGTSANAAPSNRVTGTVETALFLGEYREVEVRVGDVTLMLRVHPTRAVREGEQVELYINPSGCRFLTEVSGE